MKSAESVDIKAFIDARKVSPYQWLVLVLCFVIVMMDGLDTAVMGFVAPVIMHDWSVSRTAFGPVMSAAMVGLAVGLGARYPRFGADPSQVAGSYGGVAFMMQAVLFVIVMIALLGWPSSLYLIRQVRGVSPTALQWTFMAGCLGTAVLLSTWIWLASMRSGIGALERMAD